MDQNLALSTFDKIYVSRQAVFCTLLNKYSHAISFLIFSISEGKSSLVTQKRTYLADPVMSWYTEPICNIFVASTLKVSILLSFLHIWVQFLSAVFTVFFLSCGLT